MKADDPRAVQWRRLLRHAMDEAAVTQAGLADVLGVTAARVSQWLADTTERQYAPPDPDVVFAIEDHLGCRDMLAGVLGYRRVEDITPTVEALIEADPDLTAVQKETLLVQLASSRQAARDRRSRRRRPPV